MRICFVEKLGSWTTLPESTRLIDFASKYQFNTNSSTDFLTNPLPSSSLFSLMRMFPCQRPDPFRRTDGGNGFIQRRIFGGGRGRSLGQAIQDSFAEPQNPIVFLAVE